jgi:4-amino-4-deoxy-L-arabinose transferase-like glycosyltransferase
MSSNVAATTEQEVARETASDTPGSLRALWIILAAALVVRIALWSFWQDMPVRIVDAQDYNRLALGLLNEGAYLTPSGNPSSLRPPLYPVLVAGVYRVFGAENYAVVRFLQAVLGLVTALLTYYLGRNAFSHRVGLWSAAWCAFYPSLLGFNNLLLTETLFTLLVTAITLAVVVGLRRASVPVMAGAGVLLGLGALTRSILWLFAPLLALYVVCTWRERGSKRYLAGAALFACFLAVIAPWAYRNTRVQKTLTIIDCMGGRNAMMGNYDYTPLERSWATISIVKGEHSWGAVLSQHYPEYNDSTQGQRDKLAMKYGIAFALSHPLLTIQRDAVRFFNYWQLERTLIAGARSGMFGTLPTVAVIGAALLICGSYALAVWAGVFGLLMKSPADRRVHWFLVFSIVFPCLIHTLIFAHSRYHLPTMPILLIYATAALLNWRELWSRRREWSFRVAAILCVLLVLGWAREFIFVDLAKVTTIAT